MDKVIVKRYMPTNRLYIQLKGILTVQDILKEKLLKAMLKMNSPFGSIIIHNELEPLSEDVHKITKEIMKLVSDGGLRKIIMVVGDNIVTHLQQAKLVSQ